MDVKNKRGAMSIGEDGTLSKVAMGILAIFIGMVVIFSALDWDRNNPGEVIGTAFNEASDVFLNIFGPLFSALLGADGENLFLMVLTFILVSIVIVGTLDSIDIFGQGTQGQWMNFGVGIITAIIGVRFMPVNMWASLTAPSSAFVAAILVAIPFAAMFFISMRIQSTLARKLIWIFYMIFMSYLIFFPTSGAGLGNRFMWIYILFLFLAAIMMFFDETAMGFIRTEKVKSDIVKRMNIENLAERSEKQKDLKKWIEHKSEHKVGSRDWKDAEKVIKDLRAEIKALEKHRD